MKFDISSWALRNQKLLAFLTAILVLGGVFAYYNMPKLEDPEIEVRQAVVVGIYPGASAHQVELEVTEPLEQAISKTSGLGFMDSYSYSDMCYVLVSLDVKVTADDLQRCWDQMRHRIDEADLPAGCQVLVRDDFGDVAGMFYALTGDGMSYHELESYAELIKKELMDEKGVGRIDIYGKRKQCVNIQLRQDKLASLGVSPTEVLATLNGQNANAYAGYYVSGGQRIRVSVNDRYKNPDDIRNLILQGHENDQIRLGDIANVVLEDEKTVREELMRDGQPALGICIAAQHGTDITKVGNRVEKRLAKLQETRLPAGVEMQKIFYQPERVESAINTFILNLVESVLLVILLLVFCMNVRSGIILGITLVTTVLGTIFTLYYFDGTLQRVSLGSFILVMGMLVDNAIVIVDGILVDKQAGKPRRKALTDIGRKTAMPLLAATAIAILAFLPIYLSPDVTGLYVHDMFIVLAVALLLSWVLALVVVPILASRWIYSKSDEETAAAAAAAAERQYSGRWYEFTRRVLESALRHRWATVFVMVLLLVLSVGGYFLLPKGLFPDMEYDQMYMEYKLPEGTSSRQVKADLEEIRQQLDSLDYITHITTSIGGTPGRYNLVRSVVLPSLSYGELIIDCKHSRDVEKHIAELQRTIADKYPDAYVRFKRYNLMFMRYPVEIGFVGPDPAVLHQLTDSVMAIVRRTGVLATYTTNWDERVPVLSIDYDQGRARSRNITRSDIGFSMMAATDGLPVGGFYDGTTHHNIYVNVTDANGEAISNLDNATVFGMIPNLSNLFNKEGLFALASSGSLLSGLNNTARVGEVASGIRIDWEEPVVVRYNGKRIQCIQGAPANGCSIEDARKVIENEVAKMDIPEGYSIEWGGEKMATDLSMENLFSNYPLCILLMIAILVWLFRDFRSPLLLLCCVPLVFVGVIPAMLLSGQNFGFVAIVGVLGLVGMMLKNGIVLMDEIKMQIADGKVGKDALIDSALSRLRPVTMASFTTVLGMVPLLFDDMFSTMAASIMGGLTIGTFIVLVFIPVLYSLFYKIK